MKRQEGFTYIELLVALAILLILISIVAVSGLAFLRRAQEHAMAYEREIVNLAIAVYNTHDLTNGGDPILASPGTAPVRIDPQAPTAPPFAKYLKAPTKYYYTWEEGGKSLDVYSRADPNSRLP